MVSVDLYDTLYFEEDYSGSIHLQTCVRNSPSIHRFSGDRLPPQQDNLIVRAAILLRDYAGVRSGVRVRLIKRIPIAAGMAGGSSDAAATLVALNRLWKLGLSAAELATLAARLGSDICFFVPSVTAAVCRGRGELVEPRYVSDPLHFVVGKPAAGLATASVFSRCRIPNNPRSVDELARALDRHDLSRAGHCLHNRLQQPAEELCTQITELKNRLSKHQLPGVLMTGSGSACYGMCYSRKHAHRTASALRNSGCDRVFVVKSGT